MNKTFKVKIGKKIFDTRIGKENPNILRYSKMTVTRVQKKTIEQLLQIEENIKYETCALCGKKARYIYDSKIDHENMIIHFFNLHQVEKYGYKVFHCALGKKCTGKKLNSNSSLLLEKTLKISKKEALKIIHDRNKSLFYKENHNTNEDYLKYQTRDVNWFKNRFNDEWEIKWKIHKTKISDHTKHKYQESIKGKEFVEELSKKKAIGRQSWWVEKYGEKEGIERWKKWKKGTACTLENFINRHGKKEGKKRLKKYEEQSKRKTKEKFTDKYGQKEGLKRYQKYLKKITITENLMISKYGKIEGKKRYKKWKTGVINGLQNRNGVSNESIVFFNDLIKLLELDENNVKWKNNEFHKWDHEFRRNYMYDFYFKINNTRFIIEYDTPFCHPNLDYQSIDEFKNWKNIWNLSQTPKEKQEYDQRKKEIARNSGIIVITAYIDKNNPKEKVLQNIKKFVEKRI